MLKHRLIEDESEQGEYHVNISSLEVFRRHPAEHAACKSEKGLCRCYAPAGHLRDVGFQCLLDSGLQQVVISEYGISKLDNERVKLGREGKGRSI